MVNTHSPATLAVLPRAVMAQHSGAQGPLCWGTLPGASNLTHLSVRGTERASQEKLVQTAAPRGSCPFYRSKMCWPEGSVLTPSCPDGGCQGGAARSHLFLLPAFMALPHQVPGKTILVCQGEARGTFDNGVLSSTFAPLGELKTRGEPWPPEGAQSQPGAGLCLPLRGLSISWAYGAQGWRPGGATLGQPPKSKAPWGGT